jgi:hypothetical protein
MIERKMKRDPNLALSLIVRERQAEVYIYKSENPGRASFFTA